ncbi:MAG TPA: OmpA family protein [Patescibacteria group bacterium]|nr:OmpA family protein [Patescibacteria group bacterium]
MRQRTRRTEGTDDPFSVSITDLMCALLSVFILAFAYFLVTFNQAAAQLNENTLKRADILKVIQQEMKDRNIDVAVDLELGVLRLPEGVLFDLGEAELKPHGQEVVGILGPVINEVLNRPRYQGSVNTVFVEGHTDNLPIQTDKFASNWELSTQRAINTFHAALAAAPGLAQLRNTGKEALVSCGGYADTRPIKANDTEAGRQENRRIDFRFFMTPPTQDDLRFIRVAPQGAP